MLHQLQYSYTLHLKYSGKCQPNLLNLIETCEALRCLKELLPSNDMIAKCFIVNFMCNKEIYNLFMSEIPVKSFLVLTTHSRWLPILVMFALTINGLPYITLCSMTCYISCNTVTHCT